MYFGWKARFTLGSYAPSFLLILLPLQTISGLWVGKSISDFPLNWNSKVIHKPRAHQYFGSLDDVLVFVVESQYSSPVTLTIGKECIITAFIDSKDATDFLAEIAQTEPPDEYRCSPLRIRVMTLRGWLDKVDPTKKRLPSKVKYKLVRSSRQTSLEDIYAPISSHKSSLIALFFSRNLTITSKTGKVITPLFLDLDDLMTHIKAIDNIQHRDLIVKSIEALSLTIQCRIFQK